MSGIPVYTRVDTTAAEPSGVTPQTAAPGSHQDSSRGLNPLAPTTTTTPSTSTSKYPPARPGAAAVPTATEVPSPWPTNTQPTPVYHGTPDEPPAPQPGAVPTPTSKKHVPPPPKVGEVYHPPEQTVGPPTATPLPQPYPPQMSIPPPIAGFSGGQPPASSTSTLNTASSPYPSSLPISSGSPGSGLEHQQGYQQNVYASELTSDQRRGNESIGLEREGGLESDSVWDTLGKMAQQAGAKIAEAEADVWRKINKE